MVPGIKLHKKRWLNERRVATIGELLADNSERPGLTRSSVVSKFRDNLEAFKEAEFIEKLDQYVVGVDHSPSSVA